MSADSKGQAARRGGEATRDRILDVAADLFGEQGFEATSLRQIAERLGVTKAALYYHFKSKDEILLALHLRLHALGRDVLERFATMDDAEIAAGWPGLIDSFIELIMENRELVLVHTRNQRAFEQIARESPHAEENDDVEQRFRRLLASPQIPLEQRVRMAASVGAALATVMGAGEMFGGDATEDVADLARGIVQELFAKG